VGETLTSGYVYVATELLPAGVALVDIFEIASSDSCYLNGVSGSLDDVETSRRLNFAVWRNFVRSFSFKFYFVIG